MTLPLGLGALSGLGEARPWAWELLGVCTLLGLGLLAWLRVRRGPPPPAPIELGLALLAGQALGLSVLVGGHAARLLRELEPVCLRLSRWSALLGLGLLALLAGLPGLRRAWGRGVIGLDPRLVPPPLRGAWAAIALAWAVVHLPVWLTLPALMQPDSCTNVMEPDLFAPMSAPLHHTPLYSALIKSACGGSSILAGLAAVTALQHLLVLGLALGVEALTRRGGARPGLALLAGLLVSVDVHLNQYAQSIMTEVPATALLVGAVAALARAERAGPAGRWIVLGGLLGAATALTRQVAELWFVVGLGWLTVVAAARPRPQATLAFALASLLPLAGLIAHNAVFEGHAALTAGGGRTFVPRLTMGMPDLSDPGAPAGDELERARALIWREQNAGWYAAHRALETELGWDEQRVAAVVHQLYLEQLRRYPLRFLRVTLDSCRHLLRSGERWQDLMQAHEEVTLPTRPADWPRVASGAPAPAWLQAQDRFVPTTTLWVLIPAALAPLLARGAARRLALLALGSAGYLVLIPALVEQPITRYRLPATPLLALCAALGLSGALDRWARGRETGAQR